MVVSWPHKRGGPARCLGRLVLPAGAPPAGVLSELRDNPAGRGITSDAGGAATALLRAATAAGDAGLAAHGLHEMVRWVLHHGSFSSFDNPAAPETFTAAGQMHWDGSRYRDGLRGHRLLPAGETRELLVGAELEPVPDVLARLGWQS